MGDPWSIEPTRHDPREPLPKLDGQAWIEGLGRRLTRVGSQLGDLRDHLPAALGGPQPVRQAALTDLLNMKRPADAPLQVKVPPELQMQFYEMWALHALEGKNERGGTLALNKDTHQIELVNTDRSSIGDHFNVDLDVDGSHQVVGTFHTHLDRDPVIKDAKTNPKGLSDTAPGGGDFAFALEKRLDFCVVQAVTTEFMFVRTAETPARFSADDTQRLKEEYQKAYDAGIGTGTFRRANEDVSQRLAGELAAKYHMAYYEGKDGVFTRVVPPPPAAVP